MARLLFIHRESNQMWKITVGLVALQFALHPRGGSPPAKPGQGHRQPLIAALAISAPHSYQGWLRELKQTPLIVP